MKGMGPLGAQKLYIDSLIQLLTELVHRYPKHDYTEYLKKALCHLQSMDVEQEDAYEDVYDPSKFENDPHFLNSFDTQQLSPPLSYTYPPTPITYDSDDREVAMTLAPKESLERLQTEITVLTEQMDQLRRRPKAPWTLQRLFWSLLKHVLADSLLLTIAFLILLKKKSPIAYAILDHLLPWLKAAGYRILRSVVFWKLTV
ncbi:hypothetical protein BY458DRAFT_507437 [Sporodiniella umbellata]|nr:hypothetical protein BY458DRAFT_507437 [Sporodiniella umbellata]